MMLMLMLNAYARNPFAFAILLTFSKKFDFSTSLSLPSHQRLPVALSVNALSALARVRQLTPSCGSALRPSATTLTAFIGAPAGARPYATGQSVLTAPALKHASDGSDVGMRDFFAGKRVVLFGVVGAFTPTCQNSHVPAYVDAVEELKEKRVDAIACVTVNDRFVAAAWANELKLGADVKLLIDPDASFTKALGLDIDLSAVGLGTRSKRYSVLVEDGVIKAENVAKNPGQVETTGPDTLLKLL
jgi:peroxiredoxin